MECCSVWYTKHWLLVPITARKSNYLNWKPKTFLLLYPTPHPKKRRALNLRHILGLEPWRERGGGIGQQQQQRRRRRRLELRLRPAHRPNGHTQGSLWVEEGGGGERKIPLLHMFLSLSFFPAAFIHGGGGGRGGVGGGGGGGRREEGGGRLHKAAFLATLASPPKATSDVQSDEKKRYFVGASTLVTSAKMHCNHYAIAYRSLQILLHFFLSLSSKGFSFATCHEKKNPVKATSFNFLRRKSVKKIAEFLVVSTRFLRLLSSSL